MNVFVKRRGASEFRPGRDGKAKFNDGGIEGIHLFEKFEPNGIVHLRITSKINPGLREIDIRAPDAHFIGVGQGVPGIPPQ